MTTDTLSELGSVVIPQDLASNVTKLHEFLFGTVGYSPSSTVNTLSSNIAYTASTAGKGDSSTDSTQQDTTGQGQQSTDSNGTYDNTQDYVPEEIPDMTVPTEPVVPDDSMGGTGDNSTDTGGGGVTGGGTDMGDTGVVQ